MSIKAMKAIQMVYANTTKHDWPDDIWEAICQAIAEVEKQEQGEPVALQMDVIVVNLVREGINKHRARELAEHFIKHTHPQPKREWVGLTPEDWDYIEKNCGSIRSAIKTAEALLKEKNT